MQHAPSLSLTTLALALTSSLLFATPAAAAPDETITINHHHQLFIDDYLIESTDNITRRLHQVQKHPANPIIKPDQPWEGKNTTPQGSVIYDNEDGIFKMWYTTAHQGLGKGMAYAVSADGVHWDKPKMDIVIVDNQTTNLVIPAMQFGYMYQPYCVLKDLREPDPNRRYKLAFLSIQRNITQNQSPTHPGTRRGLGIAFSPDGLRWTLAKDFAADDIIDISHLFVDPYNNNQFTLFGRTLTVPNQIKQAWGHYPWFEKHYNGRAVVRSSSTDFLNWRPAQLIMTADLQDPVSTQIYSMNVFPYQGLYLGLVQRYISQPGIGTIDIQLAISRDGVNFTRPFREPFFPLGPIGTWDRFMLHSMSGPPLKHGDQLRFYYGGRSYRHRPTKIADSSPTYANIGLASIPQDRFVAVEASFDGGTLTTKPLNFTGDSLYLNANTAFGKITLRLLDQNNNPIPGYETTLQNTDTLQTPIQFPGKSITQLGAQPIRLQFTLQNAQLYSFWIQ